LRTYDLATLGWSAELAESLEPGLVAGRVAVVHRGGYHVLTDGGERCARLPGSARHSGVDVAVGDWVGLDGELVRAVLPRRSLLARQAAGRETGRQLLAANVDVAFVVTSFGPDLEPRRLERYLAVVWESGATPVVLLTKADLEAEPEAATLAVESVLVGVDVVPVSVLDGRGLDTVESHLRPGTTAVLLGSSGVGKSTLVNRLAGEELLRTNEVRADDGKGRHTTSHRELVVLPGGGIVIDTPGLRELQLWEGDLDEAFADVEDLAADCRFSDCSHTREPDCAVLAAIDEGELPLDRLRNYRKLQRELLNAAVRQDAHLRHVEARRWAALQREGRERARRR
jgi:ribosome biogenesis GTPase